jgi:LruC domain-containing protein
MKSLKLVRFALGAGMMLATFVGCVDDNKDLYDPTITADNPLDITAPDGFDWSTTNTIRLSVEANDEYNGQYDYIIEVFDNNPIASAADSISSLAKGVAKSGHPFVLSAVTIAKSTTDLFIRQTDPKGRAVIRSFPVQSNMTCSFTDNVSVSASTRSAISTRALATTRAVVPVPDYTSIPGDAREISSLGGAALEAGKNYKITGTYNGSFTFWGSSNVKLYIQGTWNMPSDFQIQTGLEIIVMSGAKILANKNASFVGSSSLTIMPNGVVELNSLTFSNQEGHFKNWGSLTLGDDFTMSAGGLFYSKGTIVAKNGSFNNASPMQNDGTITLDGKLTMPSNASFINTGEVTAKDLDVNGVSLTNEGKMIFDQISSVNNSTVFNSCYMEAKKSAVFSGCRNFVLDQGYLKGKNLTIRGCVVKLNNGSMIEATNILHNQSEATSYDGGTTGNRSLIKADKVEGQGITYSGKLTVESDHHFTKKPGENWKYTLNSPAEMAGYGDSNVVIEICTGTANGGNPGTDPGNPTFPIESVNDTKYTYLFEDQWPLYGDYDMNDVVIRVKKTTMYLNASNKVEKFKLEAELVAVGASKNIAAGLQLDDVAASLVSSVEYGSTKPSTLFSYASQGVEAGQSKAVIPFFANAHAFMGNSTNAFVNTVIGSTANVSVLPTIVVTATFSSATLSPESFAAGKLNLFIITDGQSNNRKEVHVVNYRPTDKASTTFFGNNNDGSSATAGKYYVSKDNLAWGICVASSVNHPKEYAKVTDVFPNFASWVTSGGSSNTDWYTTYNSGLIFK